MTVFRAATLRTFFFAFHAGAKELKMGRFTLEQGRRLGMELAPLSMPLAVNESAVLVAAA